MLLPVPMYMGSFGACYRLYHRHAQLTNSFAAMGIMVLFEIQLPASNLWTALSAQFVLAYFTLSLSLNILLTLLIVLRLLIHRHRAREYLGATHATNYTSIVAMLVESSALYTAFSLIFIVSYVRKSAVQNLFLPVLGEIQVSVMWNAPLAWTE